jgi:hypothetical protein
MHPSEEIDAKVQGYLARDVPFEELRSWFRLSAGELFDTQDSRTLDLAASLQLAFVEYDKGEFSQRQLKSYLKQAVREIREAGTPSASR